MPERAYCMITVQTGWADDILNSLREIEGVVRADGTTGDFDVIATIEMETSREIGETVLRKIQVLKGVVRTTTSLVISSL
ncbi:MAG: Lrp/AsnC ligand binding domain-containing protein [Candidatus Levybacteria bacterium]|nr:Lrp/AsnC ligand binding domain-containing protein [Candidatus Levybacteria bacterium]